MLIQNVIPAIQQQLPSRWKKTITIQQANAKPHCSDQNREIYLAVQGDG